MLKSLNCALAGASIAILLSSAAFAQSNTTNTMTPADNTSSAAPANSMTTTIADPESPDSGTLERSHDEMRSVIEHLMELGAKPVHTLSVDEARAQPTPADAAKAAAEEMTGTPPAPEVVARTEDINVAGADGDLQARAYWPDGYEEGGDALPVIVYFHGGGWVIANIDVYDASARALSNQAGALVISVHYRQGPENRFPAAHDDAVAAYSYVVENAHNWNGDSERIAVAGESAGGNLALNVAIAARDQELTEPAAVLAVYPVAGADMNTESYIENQNAIPLGKADVAWFVENYLNSMDEAMDTRINLVEADLADLPPVTIVAAEIDPLRSEGQTLSDKLEAAGVDVAYQLWDGVTHEFFGMGGVVPEAKEAQDFAGERLREAFGE